MELGSFSFYANPRAIFQVLDHNYVFLSLDYSGQELRTSAAVSGDPTMVTSFICDNTILGPDSKSYVNPESDLHTMSAAKCIRPDLFANQPPYLWRSIADSSKTRKQAKSLNFGCIYLMTPSAASLNFSVTLQTAELWIKNHRSTYKRYYDWAEEYGTLSSTNGYAVCPFTNSIRWVLEDNSKGYGDGSHRSAVNFAIQGACSQMLKVALKKLDPVVKEFGGNIINVVHDEINIRLPGNCWLDTSVTPINNKRVIVDSSSKPSSPKFKWSLETDIKAKTLQSIMEDVETEFFQRVNSPIKGLVDFNIGPYWVH